MTHALLCFASTYVAVFALGLQSLNVNQGHYWAAAGTSLLIGGGHIALYKFMPGASWPEILGYLAGGVTGITSSMWFHRSAKKWLAARRARPRPAAPRWIIGLAEFQAIDETQAAVHAAKTFLSRLTGRLRFRYTPAQENPPHPPSDIH